MTLLLSIELYKKIPAFMKKLKSGDTFEMNHENQFKCSDTVHKYFQKYCKRDSRMLHPGREIIMFSGIVISRQALHLDLYVASA